MLTELLVPVDGSALADAAVPRAIEIAQGLHGTLHLVRVHVPAPVLVAPPEAGIVLPDPTWDAQFREEQRAWLAGRAREISARAGLRVTWELRVGNAVDEIVEVAAERHVRAIVCGTHGAGGWAPHWLGSVADGLVRRAPCPVLAMSEAAAARPADVRKILVLLDGSDESGTILSHATWLARSTGAELELMRVVAPLWSDATSPAFSASREDPLGVDAFAESAKLALDTLAAELRHQGFKVRSIVQIAQNPARTILDHIKESDPDVVAMATHGRGMSRLFLGSVADKILRASGRPTLLYRPRLPGARHALKEREYAAMASSVA